MNFFLLFLVLFSAILLSGVKEKNVKIIIVVLLSFVVWVIATRSLKVPDTSGYQEWFLTDYDLFDFHNSPYDKGFTIFMRLSHRLLGNNYILYFAIFPILNFFMLSAAYKKLLGRYNNKEIEIGSSKAIPFYLLILFTLYFSYYGIYYNAIVLRAGIAISIDMYAMVLCYEDRGVKKMIKILFCLILAFFFHASSVLFLPILYLSLKRGNLNNRRYSFVLLTILGLYLLSPFLGIVMNPINQVFSLLALSSSSEASKFDFYNSSSLLYSAGISFKFLFFYIFAWIFLKDNNHNPIWCNLLKIYIIGLAIWAFFRPILWIERMSDFFMYLFIFLSSIYFSLRKSDLNQKLFLMFVSLVLLLFMYRVIYA